VTSSSHVLKTVPAKLIKVPAVTLDGTDDPLKPGGTAHHAKMFVGKHEHRVVKAGHNIPQEDPEAFANAILTVHGWLLCSKPQDSLNKDVSLANGDDSLR
jgi:pimeloyl-ACP methyl ester carboxylesterase